MEGSDRSKQGKNQVSTVTTFPIPYALEGFKENHTSITNSSISSKEQIINQALKLHSQGNISEAKKYYQYCIDQGFSNHKILSNYGSILKDLGNLQEAKLATRKAIQLKPDYAEAYCNLGSILKDLGNLQEAKLATRKAIQLKPDFAIAHSNLGGIFIDIGNLQDAELAIRKAIQLKPDLASAHFNLGIILKDLEKLYDAELATRKAIQLKPDYTEAYTQLGNILRDLGNLDDAELSLRKAIELKPDFADAYSKLGNILRDLGNLHDAELSLRKAIALKPNFADAYFNLSLIELLKGNYQSGLDNYEYRFLTNKPIIPHCKREIKKLTNKKLQKENKTLVVTEQGLGDTLQYMRFIPYLRNKGFDISFCAQKKLHTLIKASEIDPNPLTPDQAKHFLDCDVIPLLSLPRSLGITPRNSIVSKPYIFPTNKLVKKWKDALSQEKKTIIGINWQGNPDVEKNMLRGRSLSLELFSTLSRNNNLKFVSLQKGFGSEQLKNCSFRYQFVGCQSEIDSTWDFLENAAIIANCDLI
ncbi:tetratricopeptide repeat protein, partial [Prochlorococcus marinus]